MLLAWVTIMAFLLTSSVALLTIDKTSVRVIQILFVPIAIAGMAYALWRYYSRVAHLQRPFSKVDRVVVDSFGHFLLVGAFIAVCLTVLVCTNLYS